MTSKSKKNLFNKQDHSIYRAILDQSAEGFSLLDSTGSFIGVNQSFCTLAGYSESELLQMKIRDLVPPEKPLKLFPKLLSGGSGEIRIEILRKDGDRLHAVVRGSSISHNEQTYFMGIVSDISAQYEAERMLQISEDQYRTLFDSAPDPIVIHDGQKILDLNQAAVDALSLSDKNEAIGNHPFGLLHPEDRALAIQRLAELEKNKGRLPAEEFRIVLPGNEERTVLASPTPIEFNGRQAFMVNYHDITERKKTLEALRRSEENYRNVVQDQTEYIMRYLPDGSITFVNDSFCRAFGTTLKEATSKNVTQGSLESEKIRIKKKIEALTPENPFVSDEHLTRSLDGEAVWHHWADRGIFDEEGQLKEIQAVGRDITTRKRIEESLHASSTQLEEAQRLANIGSYILDINNDSWTGADILYEIFGIEDTAELNVAAWSAIVHPEDQDEMNAYFASRVAHRHKFFDKEYRIVNKKDGLVHWVHGLGEFTFDEDGNPLKMIGVIQDITGRKLAQKEREQALLDAQTANRVKDQFISNISHEIRTPLNSILGFSDILNTRYSNLVDPEDAKIFGFMNHASQRLMRTVDSILNLSQLEAGTIKTYLSKIDLVSIAKAVIEDFQQIAEGKGLNFELKTNLEKAIVKADEYCMQQVITNLTENALKFTVQGGVKIKIDYQGSQFVLSVIDSGIGISEGYLKRIYEPYSQESEGFTKNFQGVGLGMALTKRYADLNNVEIKLKSKTGVGTTFTLIFPEVEGDQRA